MAMTQPMVDCSPVFSAEVDGDAGVVLYWFDELVQATGFHPGSVASFVEQDLWQPWFPGSQFEEPLHVQVLTLAARVAGDGSVDELLAAERAYVDYVASGGWKVLDGVESAPQ